MKNLPPDRVEYEPEPITREPFSMVQDYRVPLRLLIQFARKRRHKYVAYDPFMADPFKAEKELYAAGLAVDTFFSIGLQQVDKIKQLHQDQISQLRKQILK
jgi:hypothetical protein